MNTSRPKLWAVATVTALSALSIVSMPLAGPASASSTTQVVASPRVDHAHPDDRPSRVEMKRVEARLRAAGSQYSGTTHRTPSAAAATTRSLLGQLAIRPRAAAAITDCSADYDGSFLCGSFQVLTNAADPSLGQRTIVFVYRPADVQPATGVSPVQ